MATTDIRRHQNFNTACIMQFLFLFNSLNKTSTLGEKKRIEKYLLYSYLYTQKKFLVLQFSTLRYSRLLKF